MRRSAILAVVLLLPLAAAAGGVNEAAEIEGTAIVSVETADVAPASERFDITVTIVITGGHAHAVGRGVMKGAGRE